MLSASAQYLVREMGAFGTENGSIWYVKWELGTENGRFGTENGSIRYVKWDLVRKMGTPSRQQGFLYQFGHIYMYILLS